MLDKETRDRAQQLISETVSVLVFTFFHGIRTEKDVKNVADTFREIATLSTLNAAILDTFLSTSDAKKDDEAQK